MGYGARAVDSPLVTFFSLSGYRFARAREEDPHRNLSGARTGCRRADGYLSTTR